MTGNPECRSPEGFICPECHNYINTPGEYVDHHADCAVVTNWWEVPPNQGLLCYLCDMWVLAGDMYRLIPFVVYLDDEMLAALDKEPGTYGHQDKAVCAHCSKVSLAADSTVDPRRTQVPAGR